LADSGQDTVSVAEAAQILGISADAVRKGLTRGRLRGWKVDGSWRVARPTGQDNHDGPVPDQTSPGPVRERSRTGQDNAVVSKTLELLAERDRVIAEKDARLDQLQQERAELYGRLGFYQAQLAQAKDRLLALEAPKEPVEVEKTASIVEAVLDPAKRPWWRFWR